MNRKCQDVLQTIPFSFREKAESEARRGASTFKNMPFLRQEKRLLRAKRAYTWTQNITRWFVVGYILGYRQWHLRVLRVVSLVVCKDFLSFYCASPLTVFTPAIAVTLCVLCTPKALCGSEAPPPSPPPKGGAWLPRYPYNKGVRFGLSSYWQPHRGNLTFHSPPYGATLSTHLF